MTLAAARHAYGTGATLAGLTEPGNGPSSVAHVPACFVWAHGAVVATVRLYSSTAAWTELLAIYAQTRPRPHRVPLTGLGTGAVLFDVFARARNYEEDILFSVAQNVVTVRSPVLPFVAPPAAPLHGLRVLARGIRANLAGR